MRFVSMTHSINGFELGFKMVRVTFSLTIVTSVTCRELNIEDLFWNSGVCSARNIASPSELVRNNHGFYTRYFALFKNTLSCQRMVRSFSGSANGTCRAF